MDARTRILTVTADLLAASADGDVSTRAVCEAADVAPTALYRQFGDKEGLLAAVVDHGFESYLMTKRAMAETDDPVADLYRGWDNHCAFALENPNLYRLMFSPGLKRAPAAAAEAHQLLEKVLTRCAEAGRLTLSPQTAAQLVMSANVGLCLSLLLRPEQYPDPAISARARDTLFGSLVGASSAAPTGTNEAAAALSARLSATPSAVLTPTETALLQDWLRRLADA